MKSLTVRMIGGLGNQMHCYAFGRALAAHSGALLKLDADSGFWNDPYNREYLLSCFPGLNATVSKPQPATPASRLLFRIVFKFLASISRFFPLPFKFVVLEGVPRRYQPEVHRARYYFNPYFLGYWASYLYYQDVEAELRRELAPPAPVHPEALAMLEQIRQGRSCFIHWRSYNEEQSMNRHDLREYYKSAIRLILEKYPDINLFVFSDAPDGARKTLSLIGVNATFVDLPVSRGNKQGLVDFYLMCKCDHAIIGHSTFSWWAAWLGDENGRTVIFPKGISPWVDDWSPPKWIPVDMAGIRHFPTGAAAVPVRGNI